MRKLVKVLLSIYATAATACDPSLVWPCFSLLNFENSICLILSRNI